MVWLLPLAGVAAGAVLIALRLRGGRARRGPRGEDGDGERAAGGAADPDLDRYVERVRSEVGS